MPNPYRYMMFCAWMGPVVLAALIVFWGVLGHNIPPYSAALPAEGIAAHFREHTASARAGMILTMIFGALYLVWGMAITKVMETVERDNDVLSRLQLWGAGFTTLILVIPPSFWLTAAFRPDTDVENLRMLYDMGWILFDVAFSLTMIQMFAFGVCFLSDKRPNPIIPKWVAWLAIWLGFTFLVLGIMPFFDDGPFSRSGLFNYWVEFVLFFNVMLIMCIYVIIAVARLQREHAENVTHG